MSSEELKEELKTKVSKLLESEYVCVEFLECLNQIYADSVIRDRNTDLLCEYIAGGNEEEPYVWSVIKFSYEGESVFVRFDGESDSYDICCDDWKFVEPKTEVVTKLVYV